MQIHFLVDKIVGRRFDSNGSLQYRVRWEGYSSDHDSWEPKNNISQHLILEYDAFAPNENVEIHFHHDIERHDECPVPPESYSEAVGPAGSEP